MKDFDYEDGAQQCPLDFESHLESPTNRAEFFTARRFDWWNSLRPAYGYVWVTEGPCKSVVLKSLPYPDSHRVREEDSGCVHRWYLLILSMAFTDYC